MKTLPKLELEIGGLVNPNSTGPADYYTSAVLTVDVLTVHFATNSMRIGFTWLGKKMSRDTSALYFFDQFNVTAK